jgi:hypothetical protein
MERMRTLFNGLAVLFVVVILFATFVLSDSQSRPEWNTESAKISVTSSMEAFCDDLGHPRECKNFRIGGKNTWLTSVKFEASTLVAFSDVDRVLQKRGWKRRQFKEAEANYCKDEHAIGVEFNNGIVSSVTILAGASECRQ